jgi:FlaG/FlaF family flagellin (archaellin)
MRIPTLVQWILLIAIAVLLAALVDPSVVESPYNGF